MVEAIITVWLIFVAWGAVGAAVMGAGMSFSDACERQKAQTAPQPAPTPWVPSELTDRLIRYAVWAFAAIAIGTVLAILIKGILS